MSGVVGAGRNYKKPRQRRTPAMLPLKLGFCGHAALSFWLVSVQQRDFSRGHVKRNANARRDTCSQHNVEKPALINQKRTFVWRR